MIIFLITSLFAQSDALLTRSFGCTDPTACNYDPDATTDDGSCWYADLNLDCFDNCLNDFDSDEICDEEDNCFETYNPDQSDFDCDGIGDTCDESPDGTIVFQFGDVVIGEGTGLGTVEILYSSSNPVTYFAFNVNGIVLTGVGVSEMSNLTIDPMTGRVSGLGETLPISNEGLLVTIQFDLAQTFQNPQDENEIVESCMSGAVVSTISGCRSVPEVIIGDCLELSEPPTDCNGDYNGIASTDECGVCCGGDTYVECSYWISGNFGGAYDCAGVCFGTFVIDECDVCGEPADYNQNMDCGDICFGQSIEDCAGICEGPNYEDDCGVCDDDPTNDNADMDCAGVCGGFFLYDDCQDCVDPDVAWNGAMNCMLICDGIDYYEDECGVCDDDLENDCIQDCNGVWGGDAVEDMCGDCDNNPENDCLDGNCSGIWGSDDHIDECGACCGGDTGWECSYWNSESDFGGAYDCNGDCFGEAYVECGICCGGNTGHFDCGYDIDCNGDCFGDAVYDECEVCDDDPSNDNVDMDDCGVCFGNNSCYGCTDPEADNYDETTTIDDGTCYYAGCTDLIAYNYNPDSTLDDGSCIYFGDVNMDGNIDVVDVILMVGIALETIEPTIDELALGDLIPDGLVNIMDIVAVISLILGDDLLADFSPIQDVQIIVRGQEISVNMESGIAGVQLETIGDFSISQTFLPDGWILENDQSSFVASSLDGSQLVGNSLISYDGNIEITSASVADWYGNIIEASIMVIPDTFELHPAYPNPFYPMTIISYGIPEDSFVSIIIYDLQGQQISDLKHEVQPAGSYEIVWDARSYSSGDYLVRMVAGDFQATQIMTFVK